MGSAEQNKKLVMQLQSTSWKTPVAVEYTTRDTPQQNSPVEVGFYALANKAWDTIHHMNLPMEMHYCLFSKVFTTVTLLDGWAVVELNGKCASWFEHCLWGNNKFASCLHTIGEAGTVKTKTDTTPKLDDHGVHYLFVGSLTHLAECYRMYA